MFRPFVRKTLPEIIAEWDALAPVRQQQILTGEDISYNHVIGPAVLEIVTSSKPETILDAGCGVGALTCSLLNIANDVVALDPSQRSIDIARLVAGGATFFVGTLEEYVNAFDRKFDVIVANMVLMDVLSLDPFVTACRKLMSKSGSLVFSITHPCFWPSYYGYSDESWFDYTQEIAVESPFRISADQEGSLVSTHVHRPLSRYAQCFRSVGMNLEKLLEPTPPAHLDAEYRARWKFPRYLVGMCR
jgi:SAM-dependent methyltransferase